MLEEILSRLPIQGATITGGSSSFANYLPVLNASGVLDPSVIPGVGGISFNASQIPYNNTPNLSYAFTDLVGITTTQDAIYTLDIKKLSIAALFLDIPIGLRASAFNNIAQVATTTLKGAVELATDTEVDAGTANGTSGPLVVTNAQVTAKLLKLTGGTMIGNLILTSNTPSQTFQATTKKYVDDLYILLQNSKLAVNSTSTQTISTVVLATPAITQPTQIANKNYVDVAVAAKLNVVGGTATNLLCNTPTVSTQVTNKTYVDTGLNTKLTLASGSPQTITGQVLVPTPTDPSQISNKLYVDNSILTKFDKTGGDITGVYRSIPVGLTIVSGNVITGSSVLNFAASTVFTLDLTQNATLINPVPGSAVPGATYKIIIRNSSNYILAYDTTYKFKDNIVPVVSTGTGPVPKYTILNMLVSTFSPNKIFCTVDQAFDQQ
jgi:hypothetical protein